MDDRNSDERHEKSGAENVVSDDRFRLIVENVRDYAIFLLDPTGHVLTWNLGAERIKGYRADEIIGQHFSRFYPEDDVRAGKCERELELAARDGRFEDEMWRIRKDGSRFWANVIITALRDRDGKLIGFAKVTRDLTERKRAEEERVRLAQAEEAKRVADEFLEREREAHRAAEEARSWLATTLQSIGDAVMATDDQGRITLMNPIAEQLTGWKLSEARGLPLHAVFHIVNEGTRQRVESPVDRVLREGRVVGLANHTMLVARDGSEKPIADSGAPIRGEDGSIRGVVLVFRDATAESRASTKRAFLAEATAVLTSSLDYRETLARVANLLVPRLADWSRLDLVEPDGRIVPVAVAHVDPMKVELARELARRYPVDPSAAQGTPNVIRTGRSEFYPDISDEVLRASTTDETQLRLARELRLRSALVVPLTTGTRVTGALTLVFAESGRTYSQNDVEFAEDIGRRAAIAIENARLYAAEQRARDLADAASRTKDEFLAAVSHELRTPLTAILGWANILSSPHTDERRRARAIETISRNATAMTKLIEDLLDISRIVSGRMRLDVGPVQLTSIIDAVIESVRPAAEARSIRIDEDVDPGARIVSGDAARLQQVLWNLMSNAVKFTPKGGRVGIALRQKESNVEIEVSDTGKGIEPRFLPHVFDAFRQAEGGATRSAGGLGLGLAIVKNIVELHGGAVEAMSEGPGRGATFTVRLPIAAVRMSSPITERPNVPASSNDDSGETSLAGLHVLVVEDDDDARELLRTVLEGSGAQVTTASSASAALEAIRREVPDVLLSDIGMPDESGLDLIRRVRALPPEHGGAVPAAALTAYARHEDRRAVLGAGFQFHIPKPIEPGDLVNVVATLARFAET